MTSNRCTDILGKAMRDLLGDASSDYMAPNTIVIRLENTIVTSLYETRTRSHEQPQPLPMQGTPIDINKRSRGTAIYGGCMLGPKLEDRLFLQCPSHKSEGIAMESLISEIIHFKRMSKVSYFTNSDKKSTILTLFPEKKLRPTGT
jgi:hypothetical protein